MLFRRITSICVFSLTLAFSLFAQGDRGTITGTVTDSTGAPMPNVVVNITNTATNTSVRVTTTGTGEYNVASLQPGSYRVEIVAPGFKRYVQAGIEAAAGTSVRLDAKLEIGQVTESVEVRAQSVQLQTENAKVTSAVENKLVDELPLVVGGAMRSPFDLVTMIPQARGSGNSLMIGGGQAAAWGATLDGLSVNTNRSGDAAETAYLTPSVEAITEFAVDTNGFKAEYGQAGGGMITFASKSGTNDFHGTAYDFLRNDDFDARGFFATQRSVYKQNDFGGSVGGPVWHSQALQRPQPHVLLRELRRLPQPHRRERRHPRACRRRRCTRATFPTGWIPKEPCSRSTIPNTTVANPTGGGFIRTPFPGNLIPQNRFSAVSKQIIPFASAVAPNRPGLVPGTSGYVRNNYVVTGGTTASPTNKGSVKIDHNVGFSHHVSFFYNRTHLR